MCLMPQNKSNSKKVYLVYVERFIRSMYSNALEIHLASFLTYHLVLQSHKDKIIRSIFVLSHNFHTPTSALPFLLRNIFINTQVLIFYSTTSHITVVVPSRKYYKTKYTCIKSFLMFSRRDFIRRHNFIKAKFHLNVIISNILVGKTLMCS